MAVNAWDEPKEVLEEFVKKNDLKQRVLLQGGDVAERYGVSSVPTTLWIDGKGVVKDVESGAGGPQKLGQKTEKLLNED